MGGWSRALEDAADDPGPEDVVLLPDLFVDRIVPVPDTEAFLEACARARASEGGNVHLPGQSHRVGGTAANTALALARLGVPAHLVAKTDALGAALLEDEAPGALDRAGVRVGEESATTVALEHEPPADANVMVSDPGPVAAFDGDDLAEGDRRRVREAEVVLVCSWGLAGAAGTDLLEAVAEAAGPGTLLVVDPGDPTPSEGELPGLLASPGADAVDRWAVNEHEVRVLAAASTGSEPDDLGEAARMLTRSTGATVDAHDAGRAGTATPDGAWVEAPALEAEPRFRTGAGDAWNAGHILGLLAGFPDEPRLALAHGVAATVLEEGRAGLDREAVAARLESAGRDPP